MGRDLLQLFPPRSAYGRPSFGWSAAPTMGAFSLALAVQGLAAPHIGRIIDRGGAPFADGRSARSGRFLGLLALTRINDALAVSTRFWAWLGLMMAATLYRTRRFPSSPAPGVRAPRSAITAITLAAGFASTLAYPLTAAVTATGGWRAAIWVLAGMVLILVLPLHRLASARLEAEALNRDPAPPRHRRPGRARWGGPGSGRSGWASR